jgi:hypothetical protein
MLTTEDRRAIEIAAGRLRKRYAAGFKEEDAIAADRLDDVLVRHAAPSGSESALRRSLAWALAEIDDGAVSNDSNGTPSHSCEFAHHPEKGACDWHEAYWTAKHLLEPAAPSGFQVGDEAAECPDCLSLGGGIFARPCAEHLAMARRVFKQEPHVRVEMDVAEPIPAPAPVFVIGQRVRVKATGAVVEVVAHPSGPYEWVDDDTGEPSEITPTTVFFSPGTGGAFGCGEPWELEPVPDDPPLTTEPEPGEEACPHAERPGNECSTGEECARVEAAKSSAPEVVRAEAGATRGFVRLVSPSAERFVYIDAESMDTDEAVEAINRHARDAFEQGRRVGDGSADLARAQAREEALREAARAARNARLPAGYDYGDDALRTFNFGKDRAADAILALLGEPAPSEPEPTCSTCKGDKSVRCGTWRNTFMPCPTCSTPAETPAPASVPRTEETHRCAACGSAFANDNLLLSKDNTKHLKPGPHEWCGPVEALPEKREEE